MLINKRIPLSYIMGQIKVELIVVVFYAIGIEFLDEYLKIKGLSIPITIPAILGTAISLILGFRINQAYSRWWEARMVWGAIVNDSRTLVRQALTFIRDSNDHEGVRKLQQEISDTQTAWCFGLSHSLKGSIMTNLSDYLDQETTLEMEKYHHLPNGLIQHHRKLLQQAISKNWINPFHVNQIDETLTRLVNAMGMCERIKNTVFPKTYTLVVEFLVYLFVFLLPYGIIDFFNYTASVVIILISVPFFLLEKSAIHLQDPFNGWETDTPMFTISRTIENNLRQMMDVDAEMKTSEEPDTFYIL